MKLGVTANGGWIMTPELESLSAAPETVSVSIDFLRFDNETGTYIVSAEGAGVVTNGEVNNTVLPAQTSAAGRKWKTLTFTVQDATNKTRIKIEAQTYNEKGYRINIDNIVVMAADKTEVTEKLPAPENRRDRGFELRVRRSGTRPLYLYRQGALRRECGIQFRPDAEGRGDFGLCG